MSLEFLFGILLVLIACAIGSAIIFVLSLFFVVVKTAMIPLMILWVFIVLRATIDVMENENNG